MILLERHISPVMSDEEDRAWKNRNKKRYVTPENGVNRIEPNVIHWDWADRVCYTDDEGNLLPDGQHRIKRVKQIKFLLLPGAISGAAWLKATCAARESKLTRGGRAANGQVYGKKLTLGWIKLPYPGYDNMRTAPTLEQPKLLAAFYPLLLEMDSLIEQNLPEYHKFAFNWAMSAGRPDVRNADGWLEDEDDLNRVGDPHDYNVVRSLDPWGMTYTIRGTVFSTVEFNRNIIFKAHEDAHNVEGTLVCITTLDRYAGGRLVFPRYGYSAELRGMDLLICDNNHELHGNLGPIVGNRYSVVAFLHDSVYGRGADAD